jgi:hypothetical protein
VPKIQAFHPSIGSIIDASGTEGLDQFPGSDFIRVTDDQ